MKHVLARQMLRKPRRLPKLPWKYDHRNPEMVVCPRVREEVGGNGSGFWRLVNHEYTPDEMQQMCKESLLYSQAPTWDKDKTYY
jgi:hypothetical protein